MQDPYEKAWERWCVFTDACMCASDTLRDATDLAARYQRYAGKVITPKEVEALMPERRGFPMHEGTSLRIPDKQQDNNDPNRRRRR